MQLMFFPVFYSVFFESAVQLLCKVYFSLNQYVRCVYIFSFFCHLSFHHCSFPAIAGILVEISPLYFSLLPLCPRRFSLTISSPSVYTTASRGNLILLQFALFMSVFPVSSLPPLSPSYALSLTHYRHITCLTALSS